MKDELFAARWRRLGILVTLLTFAPLGHVTYGDQAIPLGSTSSAIEPSAPVIYIDQNLYFTTPEGTDTIVTPGAYLLDRGAESHLKLTPEGDLSGMDIQAFPTSHGESLSAPLALLVKTEEDAVHLVLLLPGGKGIDAVGSTSGIRSRAPSAPLSSAQVSQAIAGTPTSSGQMTTQSGGIGRPSPPVLISPAAQTRLAQKEIEFRWSPGIGGPAPTSFQLCIAEAGKPCPMVDGASTTSVVITSLDPKQGNARVNIYTVGNLLFPYQGERALTWTVAACIPSPINPTIGRTSPAICRYANPVPLYWKPVLPGPLLIQDADHQIVVNDRPQFEILGIQASLHYLFCISPILGPGLPSVGCGQGSVVVNTDTRRSTTGWEWSSSPNSPPTGLSPTAFAGKAAWWSAAACLEDTNCSWADRPAQVTVLPSPSLTPPLLYSYSSSPQHRIFWTVPSTSRSAITHYRLCFATQGSRLVNPQSTLLDIPGMLRDLCSGDIPPGDQPAYRKPVPPNLASSCPPGGCRMPEPIATIYTTQPDWTIDLREHLDWSRYANQPILWTAAACHGSNRNCMWQTSRYGSITFPTASQAPGSVNGTLGTAVRISWSPVVGNDYYIPCLREVTANCDNGNLLANPRLNTFGRYPSNHPSSCTLQGRYPAGPKVIEIAGCNDAWGCRWKLYQTVTLGTNQEPHASNPRLECR